MPNYDYRCAKCGETIEVWQSFSDAPLTRHEGCGGRLSKVLGAAGIVLKGSGFYKNDSGSRSKGARKEKKDTATPAASGSDSSSSGGESSGAGSSGSGSDTKSAGGDGGSAPAKKSETSKKSA